MKKYLIAMVACAAIAAGTAHAEAKPGKEARQPAQLGAEDPIKLDPTRAYIFYRTQYRTTYRFLREPDAAELAEHNGRRAAALAEALKRYPRKLREWERNRDDYRACTERRLATCASPGPRPIEPTNENLAFDPPELDNFVGNELRPRLEFADDQQSGWLIAVQPGTYAVYGAIAQGPNGLTGGCFCMGSVRFEAKAGQVTNLGEIRDEGTLEEAIAFAKEHGGNAFRLSQGVIVPPAAGRPLPPQLSAAQVVPAQLRAADKMPNYFGVFISRIAPIEGVLGYRRDEVLDLSAPAQTAGR